MSVRGLRFPGPKIREVTSPLTEEDLAPLTPEHTTVQISTRLTDAEFRRLAAFMADYPEVRFRVYGGYDGTIADLEFLRFFTRLRRFSVDALYELPSLDGLQHLPEGLEELAIGRTRSRRFSIRNLLRFQQLRRLWVEGQQKGIESIGELAALENLVLRSITLPNLASLLPLERLSSLAIMLGGTSDLALLPRIGRLAYLELWRIRGLRDLSSIADIASLQRLYLQSMSAVTSLPSFARSSALRSAALYTMRGIVDLSPLAEAPNLDELKLIDMCHLQPEDLRPLMAHPTLRYGIVDLCSQRKNAAARELLPLAPRRP